MLCSTVLSAIVFLVSASAQVAPVSARRPAFGVRSPGSELSGPMVSSLPQGGPDGFGYHWESTQDNGDTVTFFWLDPSSHEPLDGWFPNPDDGWKRVSLPFRFPFYGDTLDSIVVCSNGFLEFPVCFTTYENRSLPAPEFPFLLALLWDDLSPSAGSIRRGDDPALRLTCITWHNVVRFNTAETLSAQILLYHDGRIRLNILRAPHTGDSCTIGIQGHSGANGFHLQYLYNGSPTQHVPEDSTSILFHVRRLAHDVGVFLPGTPSGWIPTGAQIPVTGYFKNYGLSAETFPVSCHVVRSRVPRDTVFTAAGTVSALSPGDTAGYYFGDWLVPSGADSWHLLLETRLAQDMRTDNDTGRFSTTSFPPAFGTIIGSWDHPELGNGMNLAGITYCPENDRFYLVANRPNRVFSFAPGTAPPELRPEPFALRNFYTTDATWSVAADSGLWIGHLPPSGPGTILARYSLDGSFTGDTWDIAALSPSAWFAGLDRTDNGTLLATEVGGQNRILELDPTLRTQVRTVVSAPASYRACSFLGDHRSYVFTGGWNQGSLFELDIAGTTVRTSPLADLADLDIHRPEYPSADSFVYAYATTSTRLNTILQVSLGRTWNAVGVREPAPPLSPCVPTLRPFPAILGAQRRLTVAGLGEGTELRIYSADGRLIRTLAADRQGITLASLAPGVYLLTAQPQSTMLSWKLVVPR